MVNSATALLASGDTATPLRALIYLAVSQYDDGGFPQNFWVNGDAYWSGIQLDEVAFPIMLAWRLRCEKGLADFDPFNLVSKGAAFLIRNGPVTQQERWEEAAGYSPSTLASNIAALVCASLLFREQCYCPARNVVDGGFLELVRYGIRKPDDPSVVATLKVIDAVLKTDTPAGPTWHRYNHDGYGQQQGGGPFTQHGVGRVWPLLTGERGHYELAAGRSTGAYIRAMENLASTTGLL